MVIQSYNNNDIDFAIIIYYIILYLLFLIAEIVLLPSGFLGQQVGLKGPAGIDLYLSIPWFAASLRQLQVQLELVYLMMNSLKRAHMDIVNV